MGNHRTSWLHWLSIIYGAAYGGLGLFTLGFDVLRGVTSPAADAFKDLVSSVMAILGLIFVAGGVLLGRGNKLGRTICIVVSLLWLALSPFPIVKRILSPLDRTDVMLSDVGYWFFRINNVVVLVLALTVIPLILLYRLRRGKTPTEG